MPITVFLLCFFDDFNLCNPDDRDDFNFDHWEYTLRGFRERLGNLKPLEKEGAAYFPPIPYSKEELDEFKAVEQEPPLKDKLTFKEVINVLEEAKFSADKDAKLKEKWTTAFHADFVKWFELSAPRAYAWRNNKWALRFMLSW